MTVGAVSLYKFPFLNQDWMLLEASSKLLTPGSLGEIVLEMCLREDAPRATSPSWTVCNGRI